MAIHKTVLLDEAIEALNLKKGDIVVDATLGGGGHSRKILEIIGEKGRLIAIDQDIEAIKSFIKNKEYKIQDTKGRGITVYKNRNIYLVNSNFSKIREIVEILKIGKVDAILADFGLSSDQLDDSQRGFSFQKDSPLDMRMDISAGLDAKRIVNKYSEEDLIRIFSEYGEERYAKSIAKKITEARKIKPVERTSELVEIIGKAVPEKYKHGKIHFSTKVFQALRMETNQELESIRNFLKESVILLSPGGRLAVISFHSGEDRIVKHFLKEKQKDCVCPPELPICRCDKKQEIKMIGRRPTVPSEEEIKVNPRSRSAKLRVAQKK